MKTTKNIVQIKSPREGVGLCGRATIGIFSCKLKKLTSRYPMKYIAQGSVILIFRLTGLSHTALS